MSRAGVFVVLSNRRESDGAAAAGEPGRFLSLPGFSAVSRYRVASDDDLLAPNLTAAATRRVTVYEVADVSVVREARATLSTPPDVGAEDTATIYEQISENTTKATLPHGVEAPRADRVPDGPPAVVVIFSQPRSEADEAEYNRWYDEIHTGETLLLPGYTRSRRFRQVGPEEQLVPEKAAPFDRRYLTLYEVDNVHCIPLARQAMPWFKSISVEFASPALHPDPPECWTYELVSEERNAEGSHASALQQAASSS